MTGITSRFTALASALLLALIVAPPARAQTVDQKIQALEQELSQLKDQQVELKKEATAAAAAMPTFSFRPGNGVMIEAADKSWSFRTSLELISACCSRAEFPSRPDQRRDHGPAGQAVLLLLRQQLFD